MITTTVIDSVRSLLPTLRSRRQDIEQPRRLPPHLAKALRDTGIFTLAVPHAVGAYVSGLCGTGSNDFSAEDIFVPEHRIFALVDPAGHRSEPLYRLPPIQLFVFQLASVSLGIARRSGIGQRARLPLRNGARPVS